jgi:hypothetical protein
MSFSDVFRFYSSGYHLEVMKTWKGGNLYDKDAYDTRRHQIIGSEILKEGFVQNIKNKSVVSIEKALEDLLAKEQEIKED